MKSAISFAARIALFAFAIGISASSTFASSPSQAPALAVAQDTKPTTKPGVTPPPPPTKETPAKKQPTSKPESKPQADDNAPLVYVLMQTTMGDIVIELNREKAPITVKNFLSYTDKKYYDGTIFHRVMKRFMIQGGGFTEDMSKKPTDKSIKNEWKNGLKNVTGSISMARLGKQPDSATAQFFINVKDNTSLDVPRDGAGYAVFGKVVAGMKTVRMIEGSPTTSKRGRQNVPVEAILINKITRLTDEDAMNRIEQENKPTTKKSGTP